METPVACSRPGEVADRLVVDAPVDEVAPDEDLAGAGLERVEVDVPAAQAGTLGVEGGDAAGVDEDPAPLAGGDEPEHTGDSASCGGDEHDVVEPPDRGPARVEQG